MPWALSIALLWFGADAIARSRGQALLPDNWIKLVGAICVIGLLYTGVHYLDDARRYHQTADQLTQRVAASGADSAPDTTVYPHMPEGCHGQQIRPGEVTDPRVRPPCMAPPDVPPDAWASSDGRRTIVPTTTTSSAEPFYDPDAFWRGRGLAGLILVLAGIALALATLGERWLQEDKWRAAIPGTAFALLVVIQQAFSEAFLGGGTSDFLAMTALIAFLSLPFLAYLIRDDVVVDSVQPVATTAVAGGPAFVGPEEATSTKWAWMIGAAGALVTILPLYIGLTGIFWRGPDELIGAEKYPEFFKTVTLVVVATLVGWLTLPRLLAKHKGAMGLVVALLVTSTFVCTFLLVVSNIQSD
ncbi:MAG: hypothetical protein ACRDKI_01140 [Solirubrobacterales bacterium]